MCINSEHFLKCDNLTKVQKSKNTMNLSMYINVHSSLRSLRRNVQKQKPYATTRGDVHTHGGSPGGIVQGDVQGMFDTHRVDKTLLNNRMLFMSRET